MPPRGLYITIPMRVRVDYGDLAGDITTDPVIVPPIIVPPSGVPIPPVTPPPPPVVGGQFQVIDIRNRLPFNPANVDSRPPRYKKSLTFHWEGPDEIPMGDNETTIQRLIGVAASHIARDWGNGQRGSGIMYHECIAPSGDSFTMRDSSENLWHSNVDQQNLDSLAILVWCSQVNPPTLAQLNAIDKRRKDWNAAAGIALPVFPHSHWTNTACPGDTVRWKIGW